MAYRGRNSRFSDPDTALKRQDDNQFKPFGGDPNAMQFHGFADAIKAKNDMFSDKNSDPLGRTPGNPYGSIGDTLATQGYNPDILRDRNMNVTIGGRRITHFLDPLKKPGTGDTTSDTVSDNEPIPGFAEGGEMKTTHAIVGEKGPEMITRHPDGRIQITPFKKMNRFANGTDDLEKAMTTSFNRAGLPANPTPDTTPAPAPKPASQPDVPSLKADNSNALSDLFGATLQSNPATEAGGRTYQKGYDAGAVPKVLPDNQGQQGPPKPTLQPITGERYPEPTTQMEKMPITGEMVPVEHSNYGGQRVKPWGTMLDNSNTISTQQVTNVVPIAQQAASTSGVAAVNKPAPAPARTDEQIAAVNNNYFPNTDEGRARQEWASKHFGGVFSTPVAQTVGRAPVPQAGMDVINGNTLKRTSFGGGPTGIRGVDYGDVTVQNTFPGREKTELTRQRMVNAGGENVARIAGDSRLAAAEANAAARAQMAEQGYNNKEELLRHKYDFEKENGKWTPLTDGSGGFYRNKGNVPESFYPQTKSGLSPDDALSSTGEFEGIKDNAEAKAHATQNMASIRYTLDQLNRSSKPEDKKRAQSLAARINELFKK